MKVLRQAVLWPYGIAHFGKSLFWHSSELVFAFFLTERAGLPATWMGVLLAGGLVLSALIDLAIGWWLRGASFTLARACRWQFVGACASAAAITPLFAADLLPEAWRMAWTALLATLFRIAYALYDIPQNATLGLATRNAKERARLAALRLSCSGIASIAVATALAWLVSGGSQNGSGRFSLVTLGMSAVAIGSAWYLTRLRPPPAGESAVPTATPTSGTGIGLVPLLLLMFLVSIATSVFGKLEPYYVAYRWQGQGGTIIIAASVGLTVAQPFWLIALRRMGHLRTLCMAIILLGAGAIAFTLADIAGYYTQAAFAFLFGAANGGIATLLWASFADRVAAERPAASASAFALLTAISKFGLAAASLTVASWLFLADYRVDGMGLGLAMAGIPAAAVTICLAVMALSVPIRRGGDHRRTCQRRSKSRPFGGVKPGHRVTCRGEWREGVARGPLPPALV
ncbi:MAG: MFS transporter [Sphingomonas sp.]|uniref:MFS transporter n=1 Tax=Sphingomonas sp. TaxID=28214 RepID=UPI00257E2E8C|nr:MFS transporter [Sphingomonas sp.]MBQ1480852.1 MFS transporter [Sphingomonas sp.]